MVADFYMSVKQGPAKPVLNVKKKYMGSYKYFLKPFIENLFEYVFILQQSSQADTLYTDDDMIFGCKNKVIF